MRQATPINPKKPVNPKKALPARNEADTSEKAQAGNLDMHKAQSHREWVHRAGRLSEAGAFIVVFL